MRVLAITAKSDLPEAHLIARLARAGVDIELISGEDAIYHDIWEQAGIPNTKVPFRGKFDPRATGALRRAMRAGRFDLFHAFSNRPLTCAMVASAGIAIRRIGYCGAIGHIRCLDPASRITFLNRRLHRVMCVSNAVRSYLLEKGLPAEKLVTIYKGHDPAWYNRHDREVLREFGIPQSAFVAVCAANVRPVKGVDVLVRAVQLLPPEVDMHVLVVGIQSDAAIAAMADEPATRGRVHFTSFRADATALIGACDISVMPSVRGEGLPKAVLESMCLGVVPVVSDAGGLPELVTAGETGWVVPAGNAQALAAALAECWAARERLDPLRQRARERVRRDFHIDTTVQNTIEMYERCCASAR